MTSAYLRGIWSLVEVRSALSLVCLSTCLPGYYCRLHALWPVSLPLRPRASHRLTSCLSRSEAGLSYGSILRASQEIVWAGPLSSDARLRCCALVMIHKLPVAPSSWWYLSPLVLQLHPCDGKRM